MKRLTFSLLIGCMTVINLCAQWQAVDRTKLDKSGEIPATVNSMAIADDKLYAATTDGIWESPSMNGGDWTAFGLQGQEVRLLNFKDAKLAIISGDQLYKFDEGVWKLTKFNEKQEGGFFTQTSFAQIRDKEGKLVIVVPTWGMGIWRSEDEGETWTQSPMKTEVVDEKTEYIYAKNVLSLYAFENDTVIYGTDKVTGKFFCLTRSFDYGKTWEFIEAPYVYNPWSFHKRMYNGVETYYFGGENNNHSLENPLTRELLGLVSPTCNRITGVCWEKTMARCLQCSARMGCMYRKMMELPSNRWVQVLLLQMRIQSL